MYKITTIPMSFNVMAASLTSIFASVLSWLLFKEKISQSLIFISINMIGTAIALSGHFMMINSTVLLLILLANACYAMCDIINKHSVNKHESSLTIMLYTNLTVMLLMMPFAITYWQTIILNQSMFFIFSGINGSMISFCLIKSLSLTNVSTLQPLKALKFPLIFAIDNTVFQTSIHWKLLLGFVIIFINSTFSVYSQSLKSKRT